MRSSPPIDRLVNALKRLPGIGEKTATRLAFFLVGAPEANVQELAAAIGRLKREIVLCAQCFDLTHESPCDICRDEKRDPRKVCVVEEPADLASIERSGRHDGHYFVLGGALSPIDGLGPDEIRVGELTELIREGNVEEVILATNPTAEGDATAHYISNCLRPTGVRLSRIAYGMPLGGDLEYADHVTVGRSLDNRREIS
jgi:recombination protein RecR